MAAGLQVIATEGRVHFLVFPQGGDRVRLYFCHGFADKAPYVGPQRKENLIRAFAGIRCLPYAGSLAKARPIGPFNSYSSEDHWTENPTAPGVVLVGDAAGHNDPIIGQGLSIALRDVRLAGRRDQEAFQHYMEERLERMRRLRITARLAVTLRAEYGEEARLRRQRVGHRARVDKMLSPMPASLVGPERLPVGSFRPSHDRCAPRALMRFRRCWQAYTQQIRHHEAALPAEGSGEHFAADLQRRTELSELSRRPVLTLRR